MSRDTLTPEQIAEFERLVERHVDGDVRYVRGDDLIDALREIAGLAVVPVGDAEDEPRAIYKHQCGHCGRFSPVVVPESLLDWLEARAAIQEGGSHGE